MKLGSVKVLDLFRCVELANLKVWICLYYHLKKCKRTEWQIFLFLVQLGRCTFIYWWVLCASDAISSGLVRCLILCLLNLLVIVLVIFLQFSRLEDARNALSLNGQLEIGGRTIKVVLLF